MHFPVLPFPALPFPMLRTNSAILFSKTKRALRFITAKPIPPVCILSPDSFRQPGLPFITFISGVQESLRSSLFSFLIARASLHSTL